MNRAGIFTIISFIAYLFYQGLILQNVVLFHSAFCFLYLGFLLGLPVETKPITLMLIGFAMGFMVDMFYESIGLHTAASVFIMFIRNNWLNLITPQGGYDSGVSPGIQLSGTQWYLLYLIPMVFIHHTLLFYSEAGNFNLAGLTLWKALTSTIFTTVVILIVQFLFPGRRR